MYKLLLCSEEDQASVNIRDSLIASAEWEDDGEFLYHDNFAMMTIPDIHIFAECIDNSAKKSGIDASEIIFLSRHKAASRIPTLTVHPIGNFNKAEFGGRDRTLVKASPATMTGLLRSLSAKDQKHFQVSFEVTHHGPFVSIPATFIEIGSDESQWSDKHAARMIADSILEMEKNDHETAVGIGGGHYAPRFTEVAIGYKVNFGHMIPEYAFKDADEGGLVRMISDSAEKSGTKLVYVHRNSMKGDVQKRVMCAIDACGLERISSADLDAVSEN